MSIRAVKRAIESRPAVEGAGVRLRRAFGFGATEDFDPFLLLDDFRNERPEDYLAGFPWHPHRGIETITYVLAGEVEHGDSLGNRGTIASGDVQWMTAGSGIIHQEMPKGDATAPYQDACPTDPTAWTLPGEVTGLQLSHDAGTGQTTLVWNAVGGSGVGTPGYDTLRASTPDGFVGAACLETQGTDTQAVAGQTPAPGQVFYFLVRAGNSCGGLGPVGGARQARTCR